MAFFPPKPKVKFRRTFRGISAAGRELTVGFFFFIPESEERGERTTADATGSGPVETIGTGPGPSREGRVPRRKRNGSGPARVILCTASQFVITARDN